MTFRIHDDIEQIVGRERNHGACHRQLVRNAVVSRRVNSNVRFLFDSMKLALYLTLLLVVASALILGNPAAGQSKLTKRDKSQIIQSILRGYDFTKSETRPGIREYTILLLGENISPGNIPSRKGVKFTIVKQDEIDRLRKTRVEYYEFRPFEVTKTDVRVYFIRTYMSAKEANGSVMEYTCRKVGRRWKLKARLGAVFAS